MSERKSPIPCPPWCVEADGCGGGCCFSDADQMTVTSGLITICEEDRRRSHLQVRMEIARELDEALRPGGFPASETHSIRMGLGFEHRDAEPWVTFTLAEATSLRDKLDELLLWAEADPVKPGD